jgi:hypothetical protein
MGISLSHATGLVSTAPASPAWPAVVLGNWSGSQAGFALVCRLCRMRIWPEELKSPELAAMPGAGLSAGHVVAGQPLAAHFIGRGVGSDAG